MDRVECYRAASVAFDTAVCGGTQGLPKTAPIYQKIVEGRDIPPNYKFYSSCADRAHAKLWAFGCEREFVNREERTPLPKDFDWGVNIAYLHDISKGSPCLTLTSTNGKRYAAPPGKSWEPAIGDELITWAHPLGKDAHSLAIVALNGDKALTANYGQAGMSAAVFPGAKLVEKKLVLQGNVWLYNQKPVMRVLRLVDYIETLTRKANLEGIPFDSDYIGEVRDRIEGERA